MGHFSDLSALPSPDESVPPGEPAPPSPDLRNQQTWHLVQRHRAGDPAALDALFSRHYEKVFRVVRVKAGRSLPRDLELADVVHEALVAAIEDIDDYRPRDEATWVDWVVAIAQNRLRNHVRDAHALKRGGSTPHEPLLTATGSWRPIAADVTRVISQVVAAEDKARLDQCVAELPGDQRVVVLQRDYLDRSWDEIAVVLQRSSEACQQLHLRARMRLAESLAAKRNQPGGSGPDRATT